MSKVRKITQAKLWSNIARKGTIERWNQLENLGTIRAFLNYKAVKVEVENDLLPINKRKIAKNLQSKEQLDESLGK